MKAEKEKTGYKKNRRNWIFRKRYKDEDPDDFDTG
jgi:hypothetical protein